MEDKHPETKRPDDSRTFSMRRLGKYIFAGVICGMLASQFTFIVAECKHKLSIEYSFLSFVWGIEEIIGFTLIFLFGAAISLILAFPCGRFIASGVHRIDSNSPRKALFSGFVTSVIISFLTVSAFVNWVFEALKNT